MHVSNGTYLLHCQDRYGNTVLHLAVLGKRYKMAEFLINKAKMDINAMNSGGITALDILDQAKDSAEKRQLQATFIRAGGRRSIQFSPFWLETDSTNSVSPVASSLSMSWRFTPNPVELPNQNELVTHYDRASPAQAGTSSKSRSPSQHQVSEIIENGNYKPYDFSPTNSGEQKKHQTKRKVENLSQICYYQNSRKKHYEMQREAIMPGIPL